MSRSINNFCLPIQLCGGSGGGGSTGPLNNYSAIVPPSVTDDASLGYSVGSSWINLVTDTIWVMTDSTVGAALWVQTSGGGGGGASGPNGSIQFALAGLFASDSARLFWDNTNKRLGVGTNVPLVDLHVVGDSLITGTTYIGSSTTGFREFINGGNDLAFQAWDVGTATWVDRMIIARV